MLALTDKIPFGKHKGSTVEHLIARDPSYLNWLREEKKKGRENLLTPTADEFFRAKAGAAYKISARVSADEESGEKAMNKLERELKHKAEKDAEETRRREEATAREADAKRTREEVYGQEWGGW